MSKRIAVVISEDPAVTARPVEALRIALGLCAGDHETTVILLGRSPLLLMKDTEAIVDVDILEKCGFILEGSLALRLKPLKRSRPSFVTL